MWLLENYDKLRDSTIELQFAVVPKSLTRQIFGSRLDPSLNLAQWRVGDSAVTNAKLNELLDAISKNELAYVTPVVSQDVLGDVRRTRVELAATRDREIAAGLSSVSLISPQTTLAISKSLQEGAKLSAQLQTLDDGSLSMEGNLDISTFSISKKRKLPLKLGDLPVFVQRPDFKNHKRRVSWNLEFGRTRILRTAHASASDMELIAMVKRSSKPAPKPAHEGLTLKRVLEIKNRRKVAGAASRNPEVINRTFNTSPAIAANKAQTTKASPDPNPDFKLRLSCGDSESKSSVETTINLAEGQSFLIEGQVASQQISTTSAHIEGTNVVLVNECDDSFLASAERGSLSFSREGPLDRSLKMLLDSNAVLKFAGVEFRADRIETSPRMISAYGSVTVTIPEIDATITANQVVMDLNSLAFDFDGGVSIERNVDGDSFPFLVKSNHVGWSLVTGEMETDVRHNAQRRSAGRPSTAGRFGSSPPTPAGHSVFQPQPASNRFRTPARNLQTQSTNRFGTSE